MTKQLDLVEWLKLAQDRRKPEDLSDRLKFMAVSHDNFSTNGQVMFFESLNCSCDICSAGMTMDLNVFVPTKSNLSFVVGKKELIKKIQGMKVSTIVFHSEENKDLFVSETSDVLEYEKKKISLNTKPVVKKQTYFHLGLGKKYLLDALKGMGDEVTFHYNNRNAPVLIISGNRKAVLMPVNIG